MPRAGGAGRVAAPGEDRLVCEHRERDRFLGVAVKAEILVREHAHVGERRGDIRHERTVPAAAPADDEPRGAHGAEIADRRGDRLRGEVRDGGENVGVRELPLVCRGEMPSTNAAP